MDDLVNHPKHYKGGSLEAIDVIESFGLGFNLGNAVKYILRAGKKDSWQRDLKKAIWYLQRHLDNKSTEDAYWINVNDALPKEDTHVLCYCPAMGNMVAGREWMDSDFCIGQQIEGVWKRCDNENISVSHWTEIPHIE